MLAVHDPLAVALDGALLGELLEHGGLGLLQLQEQRIAPVTAEQQRDPGTRADAAHADHLAGDIDQPELLQQHPAVVLQRRAVAAHDLVQLLVDLIAADALEDLVDRLDQRRIADDPGLTVHHLGELLEDLHAVLGLGLVERLLGALEHRLRRQLAHRGHQVLDVQVRVPDVEVGLAGKLAQRLAVGADGASHDRLAFGLRIAVLTACDREAGRQPLHVPLPGARQRLVEIVDVEHQPPLRRCEHAEVRKVRVAAELHLQPRRRRVREIGCLEQRGTAVEGERRHPHPSVADRHQLGHTALGLSLQQGDRVWPVGRRFELGMVGTGRAGAGGLSKRNPLRHAEMLYLGRASFFGLDRCHRAPLGRQRTIGGPRRPSLCTLAGRPA